MANSPAVLSFSRGCGQRSHLSPPSPIYKRLIYSLYTWSRLTFLLISLDSLAFPKEKRQETWLPPHRISLQPGVQLLFTCSHHGGCIYLKTNESSSSCQRSCAKSPGRKRTQPGLFLPSSQSPPRDAHFLILFPSKSSAIKMVCQIEAISLPLQHNYRSLRWICPLHILTLHSNGLIKLIFPPERYINKWTVEQIKNT